MRISGSAPDLPFLFLFTLSSFLLEAMLWEFSMVWITKWFQWDLGSWELDPMNVLKVLVSLSHLIEQRKEKMCQKIYIKNKLSARLTYTQCLYCPKFDCKKQQRLEREHFLDRRRGKTHSPISSLSGPSKTCLPPARPPFVHGWVSLCLCLTAISTCETRSPPSLTHSLSVLFF